MAHKILVERPDATKTWWYQAMKQNGNSREELDEMKKIHDNYWNTRLGNILVDGCRNVHYNDFAEEEDKTRHLS